ncbi:MAG TPA: GntR family transcriptional regulator [Bacteroidota bacterium]|nr:GntR family transcriptional regulator [Bacteroidota bacterium]
MSTSHQLRSPRITLARAEIQSLREKLVTTIRDAIIEGKIKPNERLTEENVSMMLGVSRTPLREAFLQLESEGFVKVTPRRGAVVAELSEKDAEEIYIIKSALEALAAGLAAREADDSAIDNLIEANERLKQHVTTRKKDVRVLLDLNARFHSILNSICGNEKLSQLIDILRKQLLRYNYIYVAGLTHLEASIEEHDRLIEALKRRDAETAETIIKAHSDAAREALCEFIRKRVQEAK